MSSPAMKSPDASPSSPAALGLQERTITTTAAATSTWNTKNLGLRLGVDAASAACATAMIAPLIAMIDR